LHIATLQMCRLLYDFLDSIEFYLRKTVIPMLNTTLQQHLPSA